MCRYKMSFIKLCKCHKKATKTNKYKAAKKRIDVGFLNHINIVSLIFFIEFKNVVRYFQYIVSIARPKGMTFDRCCTNSLR